MNSEQISIEAKVRWFVQRFVDGGPEWLEGHLPDQFVVGMPSGSTIIERDRFIEAAKKRVAMVTGMGLPVPVLGDVVYTELGDSYFVVTATWTMPSLNDDVLTLMEDFLVDRTGEDWICLSYLLRQDLPGLLSGQ
jgi:hypothetical protein